MTLAKIQVRGIFRIRDIRRNVFPKLIEICMETPCWPARLDELQHARYDQSIKTDIGKPFDKSISIDNF